VLSDTRRLLHAAIGVVRDPACWAQGHAAMDAHGNAVNPHASTACRWCAVGALDVAAASTGVPAGNVLAAEQRLNRAARMRFDMTVVQVNDRLGHDEVMAVYTDALRRTP
jgi:hypothetical protein